ncbi:MAG TPA: DUF4384 domain-containing protein [Candidatus Krumholzibacteriaceae bacterium]|nr:DUF4384 domain-containing protein [Candidatus Krumholzibacteriaceae bacterium]
MRKRFFIVFLVLLTASFFFSTTRAIEYKKSSSGVSQEVNRLNIVMRLVGGRGAVLNSGKELNLSFRLNQPGYVIIYNIDSEGFINLIYPPDGKLNKIEKDKVYIIPERGSRLSLKAGSKTGIEYIHALAVEDRNYIDERELYFLSRDSELSRNKRFRTDKDPYLSFNMIDETIVRDIEKNPPATDHTYFFVNKRHDYPSYLCGQCHGADEFSDPYSKQCTEIAIEKNYYEEKLSYPYPPLFNISHYDQQEEGNYSSKTYYQDNLSNDWDEQLLSTDENDIYLTINTGYDYPYYYSGYYPYNNYSYRYPSYYSYINSFSWGFGFNSNWGFNSWCDYYYPYYYPTSWYYPYYGYYDYCWKDYYDGRRSIYAGRKFTKRSLLSYRSVSNELNRKRSLKNSRLVSRRMTRLKSKSRQQSELKKALTSRRTIPERSNLRRENITSRERVKRRTVYGSPRRKNTERARSARDYNKIDRNNNTRRVYNPRERNDSKRRSSSRNNRSSSQTRSLKRDNNDRSRSTRSVNKSRSDSRREDSRSRVKRDSRSSSRKSSSRSSRRSTRRSSRGSSSSRSSSKKSRRSSSRGRD